MYIFKDSLKLEEVLPFIDTKVENQKYDKTKINFKGYKLKVNSLRLRTFKYKGCKCAKCGIEATEFRIQSNDGGKSFHLGLWAGDVQLTKDHIIPKSKGGKDILDNMQTLCLKCNVEKDDKVIKF